jgi:predicted O-methyltransferase YrrM
MVRVDEVLSAIEGQSRWEYLPIIGQAGAKLLGQLVRERRPCRAVEVGSMTGYSAIVVAANLEPGCEIIGIEIDAESAERARKNLDDAGLAGRAKILRGDALELLPKIPAPVDFVLLDGQRTQYRAYLRLLEPKFRPGTTVVANGTAKHADQCRPYLEHVSSSGRYSSSSHVLGDDAVEVSIFKG